MKRSCRDSCTCPTPLPHPYFHICLYGFCQGMRCERCNRWLEDKMDHCCYPHEKGNCPECVKRFWDDYRNKRDNSPNKGAILNAMKSDQRR